MKSILTMMSAHQYMRPELRPTILFGESTVFDPHPISGANGRLIPGPEFSKPEFIEFWKIIARQHDDIVELQDMLDPELRLDLISDFKVPTPQQLSRLSFNLVRGCWELPVYNDQENRARYGRLSQPHLTQSTLAHRVMYLVFYGKESLTDSEHVDHLCENKACCYPRHLEAVRPAENTRRWQRALKHATDQIELELE